MLNRRTLLGMLGLSPLASLVKAEEKPPEVVYTTQKLNSFSFEHVRMTALVESHQLQILELIKRYSLNNKIEMIYNYDNRVVVVFDWQSVYSNANVVGNHYNIEWNPKWGDIQVFTILLEKCFNCQMERK